MKGHDCTNGDAGKRRPPLSEPRLDFTLTPNSALTCVSRDVARHVPGDGGMVVDGAQSGMGMGRGRQLGTIEGVIWADSDVDRRGDHFHALA